MEKIEKEIQEIKRELGDEHCIMGHHYQNDGIARHSDIMGDSLELARKISSVKAENIIFCGVNFMGETAALLAGPSQKVYLPEPEADCMMAKMAPRYLAASVLKSLQESGRKIVPLAYVNTQLPLKDIVGEYGGAVCTSANAATMLEWALKQGDGVLFLPDRQLGKNTARELGIPDSDQYDIKLNAKGLMPGQEKELSARLLFWPGGCPIHSKFRAEHVELQRQKYPGCNIIVHPECAPEVVQASDCSGSTSFLINEAGRIAQTRPGSTLVIGTEENLVYRLAKKYHDKLKIVPLGGAICCHMAKVTPEKLLRLLKAVKEKKANPVQIPQKFTENARLSIERMLNVMNSQVTA